MQTKGEKGHIGLWKRVRGRRFATEKCAGFQKLCVVRGRWLWESDGLWTELHFDLFWDLPMVGCNFSRPPFPSPGKGPHGSLKVELRVQESLLGCVRARRVNIHKNLIKLKISRKLLVVKEATWMCGSSRSLWSGEPQGPEP